VVAVAVGRTLETWAGTAGWTVALRSHVGGAAEAVIGSIPEASATASEGTVARILGVDTHLAAAVAVAGRLCIGRCGMLVAASLGFGVDPWRIYQSPMRAQHC
jgi:hypothetical protein